MNNHDEEITLTGGHSTAVVRKGDLVFRKPASENKLYREVLGHLNEKEFPYAPTFLGVDDSGRDILSYIPGSTLLGVTYNIAQLRACMTILRGFHDCCAQIASPTYETICHRDFSPWNTIFRNDKPVGIIDFDEVQHGYRVHDFAYFLWTFLDLGTTEVPDTEILHTVDILKKEYPIRTGPALSQALHDEQERILSFRKKMLAEVTDPADIEFHSSRIKNIESSMEWVREAAHNLDS